MNRAIALLVGVLWGCSALGAVILEVPAGSTDVSVTIKIIDETTGVPETGVVFNTATLDIEYCRDFAACTDVGLNALTTPALTDAHEDGAFLHKGFGEYRLDLPDAAVAAGVKQVSIQGGGIAGMIVIGGTVVLEHADEFLTPAEANAEADTALTDYDGPTNAELNARTLPAANYFDPAADPVATVTNLTNAPTAGDLTATMKSSVTTAATAATPTVTISDGTGAGQIDTNGGAVVSVTNATNLTNAPSAGDFTATMKASLAAESGIIDSGTASAYTAGTPSVTLDGTPAFADNDLANAIIQVCGSTQGYCLPAIIASNVASTEIATLQAALPTDLTGTITYRIWGVPGSDLATIEGLDATDQIRDAVVDDATRLDASELNGLDNKLGTFADLGSGATLSGNLEDMRDNGAAAFDRTTDSLQAARDNVGAAGAGLTTVDDATLAALSMHVLLDSAFLNCTVNTAFFAGSATTVACILTDKSGGAVTQASNDLEGLQFVVTSGAEIREQRFITDSTWDAGNSELRLTLGRALPGTLADAVTAIIR